ncbi:LacI family DNA-binding transcriptional regulator [Pseudarthrobacter sp. RMG13]|uniref:LacI family DNA-binding transcriptional regulator n=1 Tax=Pseudarthrobacter humi TaxID=2952523 RepID=A0ABT1LQ85_9MICC|nr:LacI family DNA-binding transcriptional regulator [Pseudarthrobacter humi]MCP8999336.1 LacI family DNA-binding transcriptional regulator [Pseudarthrobacter humi]
MGNTIDRRQPRLEDVAARAKVSHQTVSRVINNHPNVSSATREKVEAAIAELGYRRNTAARSLVTRRSQTIGVLAAEMGQYGPANTLLGVQQAAREAGYFVSIEAIKEAGADAISDAVRHLTDQGADGIIVIVPHDGTVQALEGLTLDVPVILVGAAGGGLFSGALVDQKLGARLAVSHLIDLGHRRIGHVSGPQDWVDGRSRAEGWGERLREAGLPDDLLIEGDWSAGSGYRIGRQLAAERTATALFVGNDQMALGLLRAFSEAGVRVPDDVSVVGFDDQPESGYFTPPLTTVRQDFEELGRRCMGAMLNALEGGAGAGTIMVEPELVVRSSTSAPA